MILRNMGFFHLAAVCVLAQYSLVFDKRSSPPHSIPSSPLDMYYTVPLERTISKPIIAYILDRNGSVVTDGAVSNAVFTIQSIVKTSHLKRSSYDAWADSGGKLCQRSVWWEDFPERMDRSRAKERCGVHPNATMLTVQAFKGRIIADWIFHSHVNTPRLPRFFRIMNQQLQISIDSYPLHISEPADRIVITSQPPLTIDANHDFNITAEIRDKNNQRITNGLDSIAFVELTIPYYYKTFYRTRSKEMLVKATSIRLAGDNVVSHQSTHDIICRQRASHGIVKFNNIRILDIARGLKLNLTMLMSRDPWIRIPTCSSCYDDTKDYLINADGTEISFRLLSSYTHLKPIAFTDGFRVTEQKLQSLTFSNLTIQNWNNLEINGRIRVTRNVFVPGHVLLETRDAMDSIIYSGKDSSFELKYQTEPAGVCISSDATRHFSGGSMHIYFSICEIINNVKIKISTYNESIYVKTPSFEVGGVINIGHFDDIHEYTGSGPQIDVLINSFIIYAAKDVNQGLQAKALTRDFGLKLNIYSNYTEHDMHQVIRPLHNTMGNHSQPADSTHMVINSNTKDVTQILDSELNKKVPWISVANPADAYKQIKVHPLFNRICWSEYSIVRSSLLAAKQRLWTRLILVRTDTSIVGDYFREIAAGMGINIKDEVMIDDFSAEIKYSTGDVRLDREMKLIKSFGTRIIVLFADEKRQPYILRAAYLSHIDPDHGYQWVIMPEYAWQFPFLNPSVCERGPKPCTVAFRGTILFNELYNVSGYMTKDWTRTIGRYYSTDRYNIHDSSRKYQSPEIGGKVALGYDAVILFANSMIPILKNRTTLTSDAIARHIRLVEFEGLTGRVSLNENGDRTGYLGVIGQVWPDTDMVPFAITDVFVPVRLLTHHNNSQYEIPYLLNRSKLSSHNGLYMVPSLKYNTRKYTSFSGWIDPRNQMHIQRPGEDWPTQILVREEQVIPPFYCPGPCGKQLLSDANVNIYDRGECTSERRCSCHQGYAGRECESIVCDCKYGVCTSFRNCTCWPGWNGTSCDIAQCSECVHGTCVRPGTCKCNSRTWIGYACHIHLASVLAPMLLLSILLILFMIYNIKNCTRRMQRNTDLSIVDWIVDWSTVTVNTGSTSNINRFSRSSMINKPTIETYMWKNENWYVKSFNNRTMDPKDEELRLELLHLTTVRHRNLIVYGGACLTAPNVSLFLEAAPKGSLNDLLHFDSIELGWEFRYSFMKDICSGMDYLHGHKYLGSHGRLNSRNCLVDARWTIRISGFGAPTMRHGKYRNESADEGNVMDLLWTAPEFLRCSKCLDDVDNGSKAGDVYSFAIVACEIVTRLDPYDYELEYIEVSKLIELIIGNNHPGLKLVRSTWEYIGGNCMLIVRPILAKELLPDNTGIRTRFKKLLEEAWHVNPLSRPTFETLIHQLNVISPMKGELIDTIMKLVEAYSNNLEMVVIERTEKLEAKKDKVEELLYEMLPANVACELLRGGKVIPEAFEAATILFTDIVDFYRICENSSPLHIVALLNETYTVFDEVIDAYGVYKVETVSDSYMLVSGVPVRNGNGHADEICTMALDFMATVVDFKIPGQPRATLQLRIGINSGPLVAGLVGLLMPRYSMFGDTVNTASRMMTSSHALCIHISDTTADILEKLGGYDMECRGEQEVKGRGLMTTYWLWGKDTFTKELPDLSLAIPLSEHKFK